MSEAIDVINVWEKKEKEKEITHSLGVNIRTTLLLNLEWKQYNLMIFIANVLFSFFSDFVF